MIRQDYRKRWKEESGGRFDQNTHTLNLCIFSHNAFLKSCLHQSKKCYVESSHRGLSPGSAPESFQTWKPMSFLVPPGFPVCEGRFLYNNLQSTRRIGNVMLQGCKDASEIKNTCFFSLKLGLVSTADFELLTTN